MDDLSPKDLMDAADACEVYADRLSDRVTRYYAGGDEEHGDQIQPEVDRFRNLTDQLREAARRLRDPDEEDDGE